MPSLARLRRSAHVAGALLCLAGGALASAGCDVPRDAHGTLDRVRGDTLHVGVTEAPPFVVHAAGSGAAGVEAGLIQALADSLGAVVAWHWGPSADHVEALERYELDLVAGGIEAGSPLTTPVGTTRPYYSGHEAIGAPPGTRAPADWQGVPVAVPEGRALAAAVAERGARAVRQPHPEAAPGFVAAEDWALRGRGLEPVSDLAPLDYVLAVPPGENGWLHRLDLFLTSRKERTARALVRHADLTP